MKFKQALLLASVVTGFNALVQTGFSLTGLVSPATILPVGTASSDGTFILALYAAARTIPLALFVAFVIWKRYGRMLVVLGILLAAIQFADMWVGIYQFSIIKAFVGLALGCLQSYATWVLHKAVKRQSNRAR